MGINVNIVKTQYAQDALNFAQNNQVDIFILDIQLLDYSGLELAKQIRELNSYLLTPIIFSTAMPTNELEAYRSTHCYKYLVKPFSQDRVIETLKPILDQINDGIEESLREIKEEAKLLLKEKFVIYNINQNEIIYVEYKDRKVSVKTIHEIYQSTYTLKKLQEMLVNNFVRCHKGYIVNKYYIDKVVRRESLIHLKEINHPIPIGRKYLENLEEYL